MYIQQDASAAFPFLSRVQAIFATLVHAVKIIRTGDNAAQSNASARRLERQLRYDIGEIDYDPRRTKSLDNPSSHELQPWSHYYLR